MLLCNYKTVSVHSILCFDTYRKETTTMKNSIVYGYVRVSTISQNIERQMQNIYRAYPDAVMYTEKQSGKHMDNREEFQKLLSKVKKGDCIVFDSVSRMSRNYDEGTELYFQLFDKGVSLVFLNEPHINTEVYNNSIKQSIDKTGNEVADVFINATNEAFKIIARNQIQIAFEQADKEGKDISKRVKEGMRANESGKKISKAKTGVTFETKKSKEMKQKIIKMAKCFGGNMSDAEVMETLKLARNTYYKYKREIKAEGE